MHLKTTEKPSVVKNAKVVKDMLNDLIGEVTVTEYGEKLKLDKKEFSEDTGTLWKSTIKESHTEKLKNFQDDVVSSVLTSMNLYFDAMKSSSYGSFFEISGKLINQLTIEIKDSYRVITGGLQNFHLTMDNRLFIRNQVDRYLKLDSRNPILSVV